MAELLYEHLADGNLTMVLVEITGRDSGAVANDVLAAGAGGRATPEGLVRVRAKLDAAGIDAWVGEAE